jgi:hypothetical protein
MNTRINVNTLKSVVREPFAWPGGYERAVITNDGDLICHQCCKENYYLMLHSTRGAYRDGWHVVGAILLDDMEGDNTCSQCNRQLTGEEK